MWYSYREGWKVLYPFTVSPWAGISTITHLPRVYFGLLYVRVTEVTAL